MNFAFALLLMTTTVGAGSAVTAAGQGLSLPPDASRATHAAPNTIPTLIDDDGDEDESNWFWFLSEDDENDDDDDDCEEDDDEGSDDDCASEGTGNAARIGTVAPPQNGLFTNGTAPVVKSN